MARPHGERGGSKPQHHHALVKASATHLFRAGHLDQEQHDEIVKHAERGMAKAKRGKEE